MKKENSEKSTEKLALKRDKIALLGLRTGIQAGFYASQPTTINAPSCKAHCII